MQHQCGKLTRPNGNFTHIKRAASVSVFIKNLARISCNFPQAASSLRSSCSAASLLYRRLCRPIGCLNVLTQCDCVEWILDISWASSEIAWKARWVCVSKSGVSSVSHNDDVLLSAFVCIELNDDEMRVTCRLERFGGEWLSNGWHHERNWKAAPTALLAKATKWNRKFEGKCQQYCISHIKGNNAIFALWQLYFAMSWTMSVKSMESRNSIAIYRRFL